MMPGHPEGDMKRRAALGWLLLTLSAAGAQDVFIGGRVELEARSDRRVRCNFGRLAGVDLTFSKPGVIDAYCDLSLAGGRARLQEFYVSPPQVRPYVRLSVGRFLLPYGDPNTNVVDRYVEGGRDLFDTYRGFRRGNVFLDTDVNGVRLSRSFGAVQLDVVGGSTDDGDGLAQARLYGRFLGARAGVSSYVGRDGQRRFMKQTAVHLAYGDHGVDAVGQVYTGRATGGNHRGWVYRVGYRLPWVPLGVFGAQTLYRDSAIAPVTSTRVGAEYRFDAHYRAEARYEFNNAPRPNRDNRFVLQATAVF